MTHEYDTVKIDGRTYAAFTDWAKQHNVPKRDQRAIYRYARDGDVPTETMYKHPIFKTYIIADDTDVESFTDAYGAGSGSRSARVPGARRYVLYVHSVAVLRDALSELDVRIWDARAGDSGGFITLGSGGSTLVVRDDDMDVIGYVGDDGSFVPSETDAPLDPNAA
jgi:hypothetical protein